MLNFNIYIVDIVTSRD